MTQKPKPTKRKPTSKIKETLSLKDALRAIVLFFRDEKVQFIIGVLLIFFSVSLTLAFFSYLFSWEHDQKIFEAGLWGDADAAANWLGKIGALMAHRFIHHWFGIASFAFIFIGILCGTRLMSFKILPFIKSIKYSLLAIIWVSITLGFFFSTNAFTVGGGHGVFISTWLVSILGNVGTFFLLLISLLIFIFLTFDNAINWAKEKIVSLKKYKKEKNTATSNTDTTIKTKIKVEKTDEKVLTEITNPDNIEIEFETSDTEFGGTIERTASDEIEINTTYKKEFILTEEGEQELPIDAAENFTLEYSPRNEAEFIEQQSDDLNFDNSIQETSIPTANANGLNDSVLNKHSDENIALRVEKNKDIEASEIAHHASDLPDYDPKMDLSNYRLPSIDLLDKHQSGNSEVSNEELISNKNKIVETLRNFKIEISKIKALIGPTITLYEIIPAPGVRISKIKNLEDDIALSLAALGIRIIAPMPGRGTIGIEVPNQKPEIVSMRDVISSARFQESKYEIPIALGKTISNETYVADLTKMPHLLVAGATGQGKSVGLNAILASILYKKHPAQVKLVLVDPKKVELTLYEKIERHYLAKLPETEEAIITDNQQVIHTLSSLNIEMDRRYNLLKAAHVRNIKEYNAKFISRRLNPEKGHRYLPYIILVIDEFADLIMTAGKEVELPIARLAQLARAIGIHLIVATQRPSTNIITGVIKANFPTRLAFKVASMIDSRTILDSPGANQLIGRGDMLISEGSDLIRLQCAFIDTPELDKITDYIGSQQGYPMAYQLPEPETSEEGGLPEIDLSKRDELFEDAARMVVAHQQGSTSLIQRKLSIGYNRAGRIIDQLEVAGIVGPFEGSKARQVLYYDEYSLEQYLNSLNTGK